MTEPRIRALIVGAFIVIDGLIRFADQTAWNIFAGIVVVLFGFLIGCSKIVMPWEE